MAACTTKLCLLAAVLVCLSLTPRARAADEVTWADLHSATTDPIDARFVDLADIDGRHVRIPGYFIPLDVGPEGMTRFLLVPWIWPCIHIPPPPPSQIIAVTVSDAIDPRGRLEPVWLEGTIKLESNRYELYLLDGSAQIPVLYSMHADSVFPYSSTESDALAQVRLPADADEDEDHGQSQRLQERISILFTRAMTDIRDRNAVGPLMFGLLIAFLYGVVHTLGPGHGKAIVISYFLADGGRFARGIKMASGIALCHVASAVIIVLLTDFAVRQATGQPASDIRLIRHLSYAVIIVIGILMLWKALQALRGHSSSCDHAGGGTSSCAACSRLHSTQSAAGWLTVAIGAVPCTGALLIMLFGLANDLIWPAVLMVLAISLGMALMLSTLAAAAILGRRAIDRRSADPRRRRRIATALRIAGACVVVSIGAVLLLGSLGTNALAPGGVAVRPPLGAPAAAALETDAAIVQETTGD